MATNPSIDEINKHIAELKKIIANPLLDKSTIDNASNFVSTLAANENFNLNNPETIALSQDIDYVNNATNERSNFFDPKIATAMSKSRRLDVLKNDFRTQFIDELQITHTAITDASEKMNKLILSTQANVNVLNTTSLIIEGLIRYVTTLRNNTNALVSLMKNLDKKYDQYFANNFAEKLLLSSIQQNTVQLNANPKVKPIYDVPTGQEIAVKYNLIEGYIINLIAIRSDYVKYLGGALSQRSIKSNTLVIAYDISQINKSVTLIDKYFRESVDFIVNDANKMVDNNYLVNIKPQKGGMFSDFKNKLQLELSAELVKRQAEQLLAYYQSKLTALNTGQPIPSTAAAAATVPMAATAAIPTAPTVPTAPTAPAAPAAPTAPPTIATPSTTAIPTKVSVATTGKPITGTTMGAPSKVTVGTSSKSTPAVPASTGTTIGAPSKSPSASKSTATGAPSKSTATGAPSKSTATPATGAPSKSTATGAPSKSTATGAPSKSPAPSVTGAPSKSTATPATGAPSKSPAPPATGVPGKSPSAPTTTTTTKKKPKKKSKSKTGTTGAPAGPAGPAPAAPAAPAPAVIPAAPAVVPAPAVGPAVAAPVPAIATAPAAPANTSQQQYQTQAIQTNIYPLVALINYKLGAINNYDRELFRYCQNIGLDSNVTLSIYLAQKRNEIEQILSYYGYKNNGNLLNILRIKKLSAEAKFRKDYAILSDNNLAILANKASMW